MREEVYGQRVAGEDLQILKGSMAQLLFAFITTPWRGIGDWTNEAELSYLRDGWLLAINER